jgi:hypothetical protein
VHPVAVTLARSDAGDDPVPHAERALGELDAPLRTVVPDEADLHGVRDRRGDGEAHPAGFRVRAERKGTACQDLGVGSGSFCHGEILPNRAGLRARLPG